MDTLDINSIGDRSEQINLVVVTLGYGLSEAVKLVLFDALDLDALYPFDVEVFIYVPISEVFYFLVKV
jgi:hypothetical protein